MSQLKVHAGVDIDIGSRSAPSAVPSTSAPSAASGSARPPLSAQLDCGCGCARRLMRTAQMLQRQRELGERLQRALLVAEAAAEAEAEAAGQCSGRLGT